MANRRNSNNGGGAPAFNRASPLNERERQVGQFVRNTTLGEGTFGEVKLAVHKPTSERVAAKVRTLQHLGDARFRCGGSFLGKSARRCMKGGYCDEGSEATPGSPKNKTEDGMNNVFTEVFTSAQ